MGYKDEIKTTSKKIASDIFSSTKQELASGIQNGQCDLQEIAKQGAKKGVSAYLDKSKTGRAVKRMIEGKSNLDDFFNVLDTLNPLFAAAHAVLNSLRHGSCEELTYDHTIKGALQNKPADPTVIGCCVLQEPADEYTRVTFIYIDQNDEPVFGNGSKPYGFYLLTKSFDDELNEAFAGQDMLVIK